MARKKIGGLYIDLDAGTAKFDRKMRRASRTTKGIEADFDRMAEKAKIAGLVIAGAFAAVGVKSLKMAIDAQESENLFSVSMGKMADAARSWSTDLSKALGLNQYELRKQIGTVNNMLTAMGLGEDAAFSMGKEFVQLANDMASFFNISPEDAFQKLQSGISGEIEPLRRLGILVDEQTVKTLALSKGLIKQGQDLTQLQKVQLRWAAILDQTSNAQGDLARTLDSPANRLRRLKSRFDELMVTIGTKCLDAFSKAFDKIDKLIPRVEALAESLAPKLADAATGALDKLTSLSEMFTSLPSEAQSAATGIAAFAGGVWLLSPAIAKVIGLGKYLAANPIAIPLAAGGAAFVAAAAQWDRMKQEFLADPKPFFLDPEKQKNIEESTKRLKELKGGIEGVYFSVQRGKNGEISLAPSDTAPTPKPSGAFFSSDAVAKAEEQVKAIRTLYQRVLDARTSTQRVIAQQELAKALGAELQTIETTVMEFSTDFEAEWKKFQNSLRGTGANSLIGPPGAMTAPWDDLKDKIQENGIAYDLVTQKMAQSTSAFGEVFKTQISTIQTDFGNAMADLVLDFENWSSTVTGILKSFARTGIRILSEYFFSKIGGLLKGGGGFGGIGSIFGAALSFIPGVGGLLSGVFGALGGAFGGNKPMRLAGGGIVTEPSIGMTQSGRMFSLAEQGPEAIVPSGGMGGNRVMMQVLEELKRIRAMPAGQFVRSAFESDGVDGILRGRNRTEFRRLAFNEY